MPACCKAQQTTAAYVMHHEWTQSLVSAHSGAHTHLPHKLRCMPHGYTLHTQTYTQPKLTAHAHTPTPILTQFVQASFKSPPAPAR